MTSRDSHPPFFAAPSLPSQTFCLPSSTSPANKANGASKGLIHPFDSTIDGSATRSSSFSRNTSRPGTSTKLQNSIGQALVASCYPTPPPSPDLDDTSSSLPESTPPKLAQGIVTVHLDDFDEDDDYNENQGDESDSQIDPEYSIDELETANSDLDDLEGDSAVIDTRRAVVALQTRIPIPILLDTSHQLPHAATFRLRSPASLLALQGGSRVFTLDNQQTVWDRMPYSAAAAAVHARHPTEEDVVESLVGGEKPERRVDGLQWSMRQKSNDRLGSIFVHPPTPERENAPASIDFSGPGNPATSSSTQDHTKQRSSPATSPLGSPSIEPPVVPVQLVSPPGSTRTVPLPLQVLPEVRSPPRRTIAMTADSLQLSQKRGRRPKLFGFTELPDSGESASSSVANSRSNSPERSASPNLSSPGPPGPSTNFIPRRHPIRARSETHLPTVASIASVSAATSPKITQPPRKRENGLKLDFTGIVPVSTHIDAMTSVVPSPYSAKLIRKKSGEILKPALKYGGPLAANGTPLEAPRTDISPASPQSARFESKSCPTTPSCPKYVHFDSQLEHVKLFLHDQKPQVVSRSGSPSEHYTTSEGEEYPFPSTDDEKDDRRVLQIKLPNFPTHHAPDADLYLESLFLDDDRKGLRGIIMCKNFAYHKWVAVRFTFDFWQTTSEVTATHKDVVKNGKYDRFAFTVKLQDMISRIEEKTMFLAIRYNTDGREIWDSNGGQNYQVLFEKVRKDGPVSVPKRNSVSIQPGMGKAVGGRTSQWSVSGGNADDRLADLRDKLSRLSADDMSTSPPQLSPGRDRSFALSPNRRANGIGRASSPSGSPARSFSAIDQRHSDLPSAGGALAARYDFGTALKTTRKLSPNLPKAELPEVQTGLLSFGKRNNGHAATEFYSPRYSPNGRNEPTGDTLFSPNGATFESPLPVPSAQASPSLPVPDVKIQTPSPPPDADFTPTPSTLGIVRRPSLSRSSSTPAVMASPKDSPPSLDMSGSVTDTPSESPKSPPDENFSKWSPTSYSDKRSDMTMASYSSFIEQFCWGGVAQSPSENPRRTHSSSSLDAYFAQSDSARSQGTNTPRPTSYPVAKNSTPGSPSSTSSYYTSFTSTPTGREDIEAVEDGLGLELERGSPRFAGMRMEGMNMGRMSPPVAC